MGKCIRVQDLTGKRWPFRPRHEEVTETISRGLVRRARALRDRPRAFRPNNLLYIKRRSRVPRSHSRRAPRPAEDSPNNRIPSLFVGAASRGVSAHDRDRLLFVKMSNRMINIKFVLKYKKP
ncbi:hypothetical protein EVAR_12490_1 [Eumeta japonica]|uniref:Uncharacterized protein n=1 Tax=Eumeta variegata TaxID=151549 RepID=A0A4C1TPJ4_EUMVA|nr:hypothetical protein EVAR_12490_1 [Eumeta japonica]